MFLAAKYAGCEVFAIESKNLLVIADGMQLGTLLKLHSESASLLQLNRESSSSDN
jgi:hypothetical protein